MCIIVKLVCCVMFVLQSLLLLLDTMHIMSLTDFYYMPVESIFVVSM